MISRSGTIRNPHGIHVRPATTILRAFQEYRGDLEIVGPRGDVARPNSALALLGLGLVCGDSFTVRSASDSDASAVDKLVTMLEGIYDYRKP